MKNCAVMTVASALLTFPTCSWSKSIKISSEVSQAIVSLDMESEGNGKTGKKVKRKFLIGLAGAPGHIKDQNGDRKRNRKDLEIGEVADEDCVSNLIFTLENGKVIETPRIDLCNLDGILVEDLPELPVNSVAAPQ